LLAPLAKEAGGYALCKTKPRRRLGDSVFSDTDDPGYQQLLTGIRRLKTDLDRRKRFDMPGFCPGPHYVREMKKYGILAADCDPKTDPVDTYALDQAYWKSLWYRPED
jgi:hypothetical protein